MLKKDVEFLKFNRKELEDIPTFEEQFMDDFKKLKDDLIKKIAAQLKADTSQLEFVYQNAQELVVYKEEIIGTIEVFFTDQNGDDFIHNNITAGFKFIPSPPDCRITATDTTNNQF